MKMYRKSEINKSWAITMRMSKNHSEKVTIEAVDSVTGEWIATLLIFHSHGTVEREVSAYQAIEGSGYDPREHGNVFDDKGRIVVV